MSMPGRLWVFPASVCILLPAAYLVTYFLAVRNGHATPIFPYIGVTGSLPPTSCLFGQFMNVTAVLIGLVMYFRMNQVVEFYRQQKQAKRSLVMTATILLWIGYLSAFGISMVGNFQKTGWYAMHLFGGALAFGCGLIHCWGQTLFTFQMRAALGQRWMPIIRLIIFLCMLTCFLVACTCSLIPAYGPVPYPKNNTRTRSNCLPAELEHVYLVPGDKGYETQLASTMCEWLMCLCFILFFATYAVELRTANFVPAKLVLTIEHTELPIDAGVQCESHLSSADLESSRFDETAVIVLSSERKVISRKTRMGPMLGGKTKQSIRRPSPTDEMKTTRRSKTNRMKSTIGESK